MLAAYLAGDEETLQACDAAGRRDLRRPRSPQLRDLSRLRGLSAVAQPVGGGLGRRRLRAAGSGRLRGDHRRHPRAHHRPRRRQRPRGRLDVRLAVGDQGRQDDSASTPTRRWTMRWRRRSGCRGRIERPALRNRRRGSAGGRVGRRRAARDPHAPARPRRARRSDPPARAGIGAADRDRIRRAAQRDLLRTARHRQDDRGADHRRAGEGRLRGALGGQRRPAGGARGDRPRPRAPSGGAPDDLLPRRDPSLQQGPAGRAAARGRGGPDHADRGDHREPLLRGQLGAALALADLRVPAAERDGDRGAGPRALEDERGHPGPAGDLRRGARDARDPRRRRRPRSRSRRSSARPRPPGGPARTRSASPRSRTRCSARPCSTTARATSTTTTSPPGSRRRADRMSTPRSTTSR